MSSYDWLIVGLGNPGSQYTLNRHNIGFMAVDTLASGPVTFKNKHKGLIADMTLGGRRLLLLKPQTFMNLSGESVRACADFFKIPVDKIAVIYDELDLLPGQLRIKKGGGAGGHNGIKSMDQHLGTQDYWRLRCGIGHPGDKNMVSNYVLSNFAKSEMDSWLPDFLGSVTDNLSYFLDGKPDQMMTRVAEETKRL